MAVMPTVTVKITADISDLEAKLAKVRSDLSSAQGAAMSLTTLKNWSHSFAAFLAMLAVGLGVIVNVVHAFGVNAPTGAADELAAIAAGLIALSKGIDSWNDVQTKKVAAAVAPPVHG